MTILTWRDVQAPNPDAGLQGIAIANDMMNRAAGNAQDAIAKLQRNKTENADNALLADLLRYQGDPDALTTDFASGEFQKRHNLNNVSATMREYLTKAPGELLKFASEKSAFDQDQKRVADMDYFRANNALVNQHLLLEREGSPEQRAAFQAANPEFYAKANFNLLTDLMQKGQSLNSTDTRNLGDRYDLTNRVSTDADRSIAQTLIQEAIFQGKGIRYINDNREPLIAKYGPNAVNLALQHFQQGGGPGGSGGVGAGGLPGLGSARDPGTGTGIGGKNLYDVVLGDQPDGSNKYGFAPGKPLSSMTMGELYNYQRSVMIPATRAAGVGKINGKVVGSSAAGAYQIVSDTLVKAAPKVFGANWQNIAFTPENQDKLGEYLFNEAKANGTDLHKVWEGLPRGTSPANLTWADARGMITKAEAGGVAGQSGITDPRRATVAIDTSLKQSLSGDPQVRLATIFSEAWNSNENATQVAARLTGEGGEFEGDPKDNVAALVTKIAEKYGVNQAVAGRLLAEARDGRQSMLRDPFEWTPWADGIKSSYNEKKIEQMAKLAKDRTGLARTMVGISDKQNAAAVTAQGNAQAAAIQAAYQAEIIAATAEGRNVDHKYWQDQLVAAGAAQGAGLQNGASVALADAPPPPRRQAPAQSNAESLLAGAAANAATPKKATPKKATSEKKPTVKDISDALAKVRSTAAVVNNQGAGTPGLKVLQAKNNYQNAVTKSVDLALASGLPKFARKPNETPGQHRRRVQMMLVRK